MISNDYINFIKNNESLIRENRFEEFYNIIIDQANDSGNLDLMFELGTLTDFLMEECDINLFSYLDELPRFMFASSGKTDVVIPDKYDTIPEDCFMFSSIKKVTLPKNLDTIPAGTFDNSDLYKIEIPPKVDYISDTAFAECLNLSEVSMSKYTFNKISSRVINFLDNDLKCTVNIYEP